MSANADAATVRPAYAAAMPSVVRHVSAADGTDLLVRHWPVDEAEAGGAWAGPPWASVLLVHGLGEHSGRYEHVGDQLTGAGLDVTAYDHRGMGGSGGRRGDVDRWSQLPRRPGRAARRRASRSRRSPPRRAVRPLARRADRCRLPAVGSTEAGPGRARRRPRSTLRFRAGRSGWQRGSGALHRPCRSPSASMARPCRATRSVAARTVDDPFCAKTGTARFGALGPRRAAPGSQRGFTRVRDPDPGAARPGRRARAGLRLRDARDSPARRTTDLSGSPTRAPQRARGARGRGGHRHLAATRDGRRADRARRPRDAGGFERLRFPRRPSVAQMPIGCGVPAPTIGLAGVG